MRATKAARMMPRMKRGEATNDIAAEGREKMKNEKSKD
jgi:hypothetical protein